MKLFHMMHINNNAESQRMQTYNVTHENIEETGDMAVHI